MVEHYLVFVAPIGSYEKQSQGKSIGPHNMKRTRRTFDIVRNWLGSLKLVEGGWTG